MGVDLVALTRMPKCRLRTVCTRCGGARTVTFGAAEAEHQAVAMKQAHACNAPTAYATRATTPWVQSHMPVLIGFRR